MKLRCVLIGGLLCASTAVAEDPTRRTPREFWNDGVYLVTSPARINPENRKWLVVAIPATVAAAFLDEESYDNFFPLRRTDPSTDLRFFGDRVQASIPIVGAGFFAHGWAAHSEQSTETGYLMYESFVWGTAMCGIIKFAVGRERPYKTSNPLKFEPLGRDSSFPSGHTTVAFAAATTLAEQYPHWYISIPAYGIAAATGFSRVAANQHWVSDVVAGAFLGSAIAHNLRLRHRKAKKYAWEWSSSGSDLKLVYHF
jgi:membrane-associated phospholipid phosphatase